MLEVHDCHDLAWLITPWLLAASFYIEAGRRYWNSLFGGDVQHDPSEPLYQAIKANNVPWWFMLLFIILWLPINVVAWSMARAQEWVTARADRAEN